jgi:N-acyl-phosphatidylethanolamine-hydrolysing phospholipase D
MSPAEAVQAFLDLGARVMVPMHHSTFLDSTDEPGDAPRLLAVAWKEHGLPPERLHLLEAGARADLTPP